ncbi:MAG: hypothetical protein SV377_02720 [Halobacteria archaeon]|nr:hypothetical protein [Halobacteria archaeon]
MRRRRFIELLGLGTTLSLAGCLSRSDTNPGGGGGQSSSVEFDAYVFDYSGTEGTAVEGGIQVDHPDSKDRRYATLINKHEDTKRLNTSVIPQEGDNFIEDTDFDKSSLLVIQRYPASTHPDYKVDKVKRTGKTIQAYLSLPDEGGTDDVTVETVLLRLYVTDPPEHAIVTVSVNDEKEMFETPSSYSSNEYEPRELPQKPDPLTRENVVSFVRKYERAWKYNRILEKHEDITNITLGCEATLEGKTKEGFYVAAGCGGSVIANDIISDMMAVPSRYFVNQKKTIRVGRPGSSNSRKADELYKSDDPSRNAEHTRDLEIVNFSDENRTLKVDITYTGSSDPEGVFSDVFELGPRSYKAVHVLASKKGRYRVNAELGKGTKSRYEWEIPENSCDNSEFKTCDLGVYVTPTGGLRVGEVPGV